MASSCSYSCTHQYLINLLLVLSLYFLNGKYCHAFQTFGFEMHHRFSDQVKSIIGGDDFPEMGSREYHAAMAHRDKFFQGRALAENDDDIETLDIRDIISELLPLHYAIVWLGTPKLSFLVALDTGTNLLWVPCDCPNCPSVQTNLNKYSMTSSKTSKVVPCSSSLCELRNECSKSSGQCHYRSAYNPTINSSGILVEDILRLKTDNHKPKEVNATIIFGCAQVQTGFYLDVTARSGLFGLGIGNTSVPSILSKKGLVADSFSMCFGSDRVGRIRFGDKGSSDQQHTSLNSMQQNPQYNITVTQLSVGGSLSEELDVTAIFYSGTEYTYLTDPAYTALCDSFNSQIDKRHSADPVLNFEYCYDVKFHSHHVCSTAIPNVTFIMKGGSKFNVYYPLVEILTDKTVTAYCLGVIKSSGGNFIGSNFMSGHHIVFDREKMVLAWKASMCSDVIVDPSTDGIPQIHTASPPTINVQPPSGNDGISKNGLSSKAPQFSFRKPRN
ncbi:hypothetical protein MKW92_040426 [Papaver armeniacum]|nr:hypothetical protein MKW92_040426 [Papaver armeniacum]